MTGPYSWLDDDGFEVTLNPDAGNIAVGGEFPEMTIDDLPDPDQPFEVDPSELEIVEHVVRELGDSHFIIARSPVDGTFPWGSTVGMESLLIRMIEDPDFVKRATDVYVNRSIAYFKCFIEAGVDAVMTTDDYSDNRGPIMGVDKCREFITPGLKRQCDAIHELGGYFIKHTDGNVWDILDSFVEIGIDMWHGLQPNVGMDMQLLKERYGGRLCLFGGINCETLIEGPGERAYREAEYAIRKAGPGGGLVLTCSNVPQPGTRLENYRMVTRALGEFGGYPIVS